MITRITRRDVVLLCALSLTAAAGCKRRLAEPEPAQPEALPQQPPPKPAAPPSAAASEAQPGWSEVKQQNNLPLCVFASESERESTGSVAQVKKQMLSADRPVVFGVFGPQCIDPKCDELASLQCAVERSGNTLRLQANYRGFHKDGASCSGQGCSEVTAGCESPVLEAGQYTLEYSGSQIPLKIPSALNMPCFKKR